MKLIDDAVSLNILNMQIDTMIQQEKMLMGGSAKNNNAVGIAYDAGYVAALTELRYMLNYKGLKEDKENE